jgi:hypothetical protein
MSCRNINNGIACYGLKIPIGIIVTSPNCQRALNMTGEDVPLDQYLEQVPEIKELLQSK